MALYRLGEKDRDALITLLGWELYRSRQRPKQSKPLRNAEGRLDVLDRFQV